MISLLLLAMLALPSQDPPPGEARVDDVVVPGVRPGEDPFAFFAALCFDANRLDGRAVRPDDDPRWRRLPPDAAGALWPSGEAFVMIDGELTLVLNVQEAPDPTITDVQRNVCSLTLAGPHDQGSLERGMSRIMGGAGTSSHLQHPDAYPTFPGWTQLAWAGIPSRTEQTWRVFNPDRNRGESGFVIVTDPSFYRRARYVVTELRHTDAGRMPVSHIALTHLFRNEP